MYAGFVIGFIINLLQNLPWTIFFLATRYIGIRLYILKKKDECMRVQKRIGTNTSHTADGGKGAGYALGFWYIASISISSSDRDDPYLIWLVATTDSYEMLTRDMNDTKASPCTPLLPLSSKKRSLTIFDHSGSYQGTWYKQRKIHDLKYEAREEQAAIIKQITKRLQTHGHCVAYVHGPPGTGKSMLGLLIANMTNGFFCNTLKPWQPGDTMQNLYVEVEPTQSSPFVIVFDEVDSVLMRVHEGIPLHKNVPTQIVDKVGWNHLLDEIQRGMYPNTILLLTSNKPPDFIRNLDPSYIREGRVDLVCEMTEKIKCD
jgi:hypothetical protein